MPVEPDHRKRQSAWRHARCTLAFFHLPSTSIVDHSSQSASSADTEVIQSFDGRNVTMNQEEKKKPVNITREELYRQVWATPMSRLGTQYGISGNGLKKICVR